MSATAVETEQLRLERLMSRLTFESVADERRHLKVRLAAAFRLFARERFDEGAAGHISARDPEHPDTFWVNRFGIHFSRIRTSDLIRVNHDGDVVEGSGIVNRAAFAIHSRIHTARPDVVAAAHSHSVHGKALASLGVDLWPITQDACAFYRDHAVFDDYTGLVFDVEEGDRIAGALGGGKAVILRKPRSAHGGRQRRVRGVLVHHDGSFLSRSAAGHAAGTPIRIPDDQARLTAAQVGTEYGGWASAQPLFDKVLDEEPDLLD